MDSTVLLFSVLFGGLGVLLVVWRRLRLRRALLVLWRRIAWSVKHAPRDKLVLDVGAGDNPHLRADVLCDKFLCDDLYRGHSIARDRPLVVGDAMALPFKTAVFDVLVSSHLLGHLENPHLFFQEAGRVAHTGLFVMPSTLLEQIRSIPTHFWLVELRGSTFHFTAKSEPICHPTIHRFFSSVVFDNSLKEDRFVLNHWDALIIAHNWTGQPECIVEGVLPLEKFQRASTTAATAVVPQHHPSGSEHLRIWLRRWVRRLMHAILSSHRVIDWVEILACPKCHGDVSVSRDHVYCSVCRLRFPIEQGIPIMLLDHAVATAERKSGSLGRKVFS